MLFFAVFHPIESTIFPLIFPAIINVVIIRHYFALKNCLPILTTIIAQMNFAIKIASGISTVFDIKPFITSSFQTANKKRTRKFRRVFCVLVLNRIFYKFIYFFINSFNNSFLYLLIKSFIYLLTKSFIYSRFNIRSDTSFAFISPIYGAAAIIPVDVPTAWLLCRFGINRQIVTCFKRITVYCSYTDGNLYPF